MQTTSPTRTVFRLWLVVALAAGPFLVFPLLPGPVLHDNQRLLQISCALLALALGLFFLLASAMYLAMLKAHAQAAPFQLIVGCENCRFFNHVQTITRSLLGLLAAHLRDPGLRRFWWGVTALGLSYALVQGVWPDLRARIGQKDVGISGGPRILFNGNF